MQGLKSKNWTFEETHHDYDRLRLDLLGPGRVAERVGRLGLVGLGRGDAGDLAGRKT